MPWSDRSRSVHAGLPEGSGDAEGVDGGGHVVHPDRPDAGQRRVDRWSPRSRRRAPAAGGGSAPSGRPSRPRKVLREVPTRTRVAQRRRPGRGGAAGSSCGRPAWRSRSRGRARGSRRRCPAPASASTRAVSSRAHLGDDVVVHAPGPACRGCARASAWRRTGPPRSATSGRHLGVGEAAADVVDDARPRPRAPRRRPRRASCRPTPAPPSLRARSTTGSDPAQLLLHGLGRSAPGRVDSPPTSSDVGALRRPARGRGRPRPRARTTPRRR